MHADEDGDGAPGERGPFNAGYDDSPEAYDEMRAEGHMARRRADLYDELVGSAPGPVLELGSGTGTLLRRLAQRHPGRRFTGIEPLGGYVRFANDRARAAGLDGVRFVEGVGESLPAGIGAGSVGVVLSVDALHHVSDLDAVVSEVTRVSAPGAHWFAMEPNRLHPYVAAYHVATPGERTFPPGDFLRRARAAGWRLVRHRRMFTYPSTVARVPAWAARLERRLEWVPVLSGAVVLDLVRD